MIGLDNPLHLAILFFILLLIFGAKRLPEMGRSLGAGLRGFKESISGESHEPAGELSAASAAVQSPAASAQETEPAKPASASAA